MIQSLIPLLDASPALQNEDIRNAIGRVQPVAQSKRIRQILLDNQSREGWGDRSGLLETVRQEVGDELFRDAILLIVNAEFKPSSNISIEVDNASFLVHYVLLPLLKATPELINEALTDTFERLDIHLDQDITTQSEAEVDDDEMTGSEFRQTRVDVGPINGETGDTGRALLNALKAKDESRLEAEFGIRGRQILEGAYRHGFDDPANISDVPAPIFIEMNEKVFGNKQAQVNRSFLEMLRRVGDAKVFIYMPSSVSEEMKSMVARVPNPYGQIIVPEFESISMSSFIQNSESLYPKVFENISTTFHHIQLDNASIENLGAGNVRTAIFAEPLKHPIVVSFESLVIPGINVIKRTLGQMLTRSMEAARAVLQSA